MDIVSIFIEIQKMDISQTESEMDETSAIGSVISYYCIVSSFVIFGVSMWSYELETLVNVSYILF